jgi:hypothetical protein
VVVNVKLYKFIKKLKNSFYKKDIYFFIKYVHKTRIIILKLKQNLENGIKIIQKIIESYNSHSISSDYRKIIVVTDYIFVSEYTNDKIHNSNNINLT